MIFWPHYKVIEERGGMAFLRELFADGPDDLNWLFLATSGVHGNYRTLDDIARDGTPGDVTFLVVCPRLVVLRYGVAQVWPEDIAWLRATVAATLRAVAQSQEGCT